jgi:hypothetical protein
VQFAPTRGGDLELISTGRPPMMEAIPLQPDAGVTVAVPPPPSSVGKENEIIAPESPSTRAYGSLAWSEFKEHKGATTASANAVTETGGEEAQGQADKCLARASAPPAQQPALWEVRSGQWSPSLVRPAQQAGRSESGCCPTLANRVRLDLSYALSRK